MSYFNKQLPTKPETLPDIDFGYEMEDLDHRHALPFDPQAEQRPQPMRFGGLLSKALLPIAFATLIISSWAIYDILNQDNPGQTMVYIEIKALSEKGHPIAGAKLELGAETLGYTDAFGEWRHYMKLNPKEKVQIKLTKEGRYGKLVGGKSLGVQMSKKTQEPTIKARIRLTPAQKLKRAKAYFHQRYENKTKKNQEAPDQIHKFAVKLKPFEKKADPYSSHFYQRITDKLYPQIKKALVDAGIEIFPHAKKSLTVSYVPYKGRAGFIKTDVTWQKDGVKHHSSFLRNFSNSAEKTAEDLLNVVKAYIPQTYESYEEEGKWYLRAQAKRPRFWDPRSDDILSDGMSYFPLNWDNKGKRFELLVNQDKPCQGRIEGCQVYRSTLADRPPQSGWQMLRIKLATRQAPHTQVYVAGFQALRQTDGSYTYWGTPGKPQNLTIVRGDSIVLRSRVTASDKRVNMLPIPMAKMASR